MPEPSAVALIVAEYDRCLELSRHPELAPHLYGITSDDLRYVSIYYSFRAEGLGFALDKLGVE